MRYRSLQDRLVHTVLHAPGATHESLRRAVLERTEARAAHDDLPPAVTRYVDTVARNAWQVTDADVAALQQAGLSDDSIFEITVAAAVGAAMHRLNRGMAALDGKEQH
jgi:alkylhydroperoxidase family enzyme